MKIIKICEENPDSLSFAGHACKECRRTPAEILLKIHTIKIPLCHECAWNLMDLIDETTAIDFTSASKDPEDTPTYTIIWEDEHNSAGMGRFESAEEAGRHLEDYCYDSVLNMATLDGYAVSFDWDDDHLGFTAYLHKEGGADYMRTYRVEEIHNEDN